MRNTGFMQPHLVLQISPEKCRVYDLTPIFETRGSRNKNNGPLVAERRYETVVFQCEKVDFNLNRNRNTRRLKTNRAKSKFPASARQTQKERDREKEKDWKRKRERERMFTASYKIRRRDKNFGSVTKGQSSRRLAHNRQNDERTLAPKNLFISTRARHQPDGFRHIYD